jgi:hypothetical protein
LQLEVRFYNEREWRYVPRPKKAEIPSGFYRCGMPPQVYSDEQKRFAANQILALTLPLTFQVRDIKYVIVDREQEIDQLAEWLEKRLTNHNDARLVISKVISSDQIESDF